MLAISSLLALVGLSLSVVAQDPCAAIGSTPSSGKFVVTTPAQVLSCYNSFPVTTSDKTAQINAVKGYFNQYPYKEIIKNASAPSYPMQIDLFAGLDAIVANPNIKTEFGMHTAITDLFDSLEDAHISYFNQCFQHASFVQPFSLTLVNGAVRVSRVLELTDATATSALFKTWQSGFQGRDPKSLVGAVVQKLNGENAIDFLQAYADKYLGVSHAPETRFNYALDSYEWSGGMLQARSGFGITRRPSEPIAYEFLLADGTTFQTSSLDWTALISATSKSAFSSKSNYYQSKCVAAAAVNSAPAKNEVKVVKFREQRTASEKEVGGFFKVNAIPGTLFKDDSNAFFMLPDGETGVWMMSSFAPNADQLTQAVIDTWYKNMALGLTTLEKKGAKNLVIDLTGNGGGLVTAGRQMAEYLFPTGDFTPLEYIFGVSNAVDDVLNNRQSLVQSSGQLEGLSDLNGNPITKFGPQLTKPGTTIPGYSQKFTNKFNYIISGGNSPLLSNPLKKGWSAANVLVVSNGFCGSTCAQFVTILRDQMGVRAASYGGGNKKSVAGTKSFDPTSFAAGAIASFSDLLALYGKATPGSTDSTLIPKAFKYPVDGQMPFWTSYSSRGARPSFPTEWNIDASDFYLEGVSLSDPMSVYNQILAKGIFASPPVKTTTTTTAAAPSSSTSTTSTLTKTKTTTTSAKPSPSNTCSHSVCSTGGKLVSACSSCVAAVCAKDSYCCDTRWDSTCVSEVAQFCPTHGVRVWEKKLTQSVAHNRSQLMNQATDLVTFGRITTTVPKAKVLQHYADKIINIAKRDNVDKMKEIIYRPDQTVPKLKLLAARFADRKGGYTRLILDGYNRVGSDRAPLATVEYVDSPNDSVHFLAKTHLPKLRNDLKSVQDRKYSTESITLEDPTSPGKLITVLKRTIRADVNSKQIKQMAVKERNLQKLISKFERSLETHQLARARENEFINSLEKRSEAYALETLKNLQEKADALSHRERVAMVAKFNEDAAASKFSDSLGRRILRMQITGELYWETPVPAPTAAVVEPVVQKARVVAQPAQEKAAESKEGEKPAPAKGALNMMTQWMKNLKL
ncbi:hypothetical protein CcCBS67573_g00747 [Chytriomyces confervae]|uniref:Tail specific protease domain-containing protein n=1 Tax=Chytriomyces confervae TaxID=246404 RepID=A0A507FRA9_9FUNG|nr:hypothetical protein CcCBS67573_g00747 [Chytriomyces confervae]